LVVFLLTRLARGLLIVFLTTTLTFFLIHAAPGEPLSGLLEDPRMTAAMRDAERARYGLDQPLGVQYVRFLGNVATGNLGESFTYRRPVIDVLRDAVPRTFLLMSTALVLGFAAGIALGALQGARAGAWFDRLSGGAAVLVASLPDFWLALIVLLLFAGTWRLFPVSGLSDPTISPSAPLATRVLDVMRHLVLPAGTLALLIAATVSRYQRAALIEALPNLWTRTARAKGVPARRVIFRHALRNAVLPVITLGGLAVPALLGGAVFIEVAFTWNGMGSLAVQAVSNRDHELVLAIVLLSSAFVVIGAILADLTQAVADPRLRDA
jgi:peptide/nickel transport system permease protein